MVKEFRMKAYPRKGISRELEGKTALVTGASRGLGAAIATSLGQRGALVAVNTFGESRGTFCFSWTKAECPP
jgi:NAD(P)-dependent dehydrogenase (short-subunit alcohol dehydrogenase family)